MAARCADNAAWRGGPAGCRQLRVAGWIVRYSSSTLYRPGSNNKQFTDLLLLITPSEAFKSGWTLSADRAAALKPALPEFLTGITSLPVFPTDKFLLRKVGEVARLYLPRFPPSQHPLLQLLSRPGLAPGPAATAAAARTVLTEIGAVVTAGMAGGQAGAGAVRALGCLQSALKAGPVPGLVPAAAELLLPTLLDLLLLDMNTLRQSATYILTELLRHPPHPPATNSVLLACVRRNLSFKTERLFQALLCIKGIQAQLVTDLLPAILAEVETVERRRGGGRDSKLRAALTTLFPNSL